MLFLFLNSEDAENITGVDLEITSSFQKVSSIIQVFDSRDEAYLSELFGQFCIFCRHLETLPLRRQRVPGYIPATTSKLAAQRSYFLD